MDVQRAHLPPHPSSYTVVTEEEKLEVLHFVDRWRSFSNPQFITDALIRKDSILHMNLSFKKYSLHAFLYFVYPLRMAIRAMQIVKASIETHYSIDVSRNDE